MSKAYSSAVGARRFRQRFFGEEARPSASMAATRVIRCNHRPSPPDGLVRLRGQPLRRAGPGRNPGGLTVVDALSYLDEIPVCVAYEVDGKIIPTSHHPVLERCKPVWKVLPGWKQNIRGITKYEDLPEACRNYVEFIEQEIGVRITMVSNGPGRRDPASVKCKSPIPEASGIGDSRETLPYRPVRERI